MNRVKVTTMQVEEIRPVDIRRARRASGRSAKAVSEAAGLHDQYVSRLERGLIGEAPNENLERIAVAMVGYGEFTGRTLEDVWAVMRGELGFDLAPVESAPALTEIEGGLAQKERKRRSSASRAAKGYIRLTGSDQRKHLGERQSVRRKAPKAA